MVQNFATAIGGANQNVVALGSAALTAVAGYAGLKALFGIGGSMFGGFGLTGSATALSGSAAELSAAAVALGGKGVLASGAGAVAAGGGLLAAGAGALTAGSLLAGDISGNSAIDRIIKSQHPNWSADDMKAWAQSQIDPLTAPGVRRSGGRRIRGGMFIRLVQVLTATTVS